MNAVILQAETLNLPEVFAFNIRGKKVKITQSGDTIMINPVKSPTVSMRGMFNSDGRAVDRFLERKRIEKELEYGG